MVGLVLSALAAALAVADWYARKRVRDLELLTEFRDDFYKAALCLADCKDVSDRVLSLIATLSQVMHDRWVVWKLLRKLLNGQIRDRSVAMRNEAFRRLDADIGAMPEPMKEQFGQAMASCALALTFRSVLAGGILRRLVLFRVAKRDRARYTGGDDAGTLMVGLAGC
jgi:hypothetical protein